MTKFVKLEVYQKQLAKVAFVTNDGRCRTSHRMKLVSPFKTDLMWVNIDEIATAMKGDTDAFNSDVCFIDEHDEKQLKYYDGKYNQDVEVDTSLPEDKQEQVFKMRCGVVTLKHGVSTNLGLNGMDVDQVLYITEESYSTLQNCICNVHLQ